MPITGANLLLSGRRRTRKRTFFIVASLLMVSSGFLASQPEAAATGASPSCLAPASVVKVDPDTGAPSSSANAAKVTRFESADGTVEEFRQPPQGWDPFTATDAEVAFFGMPARPSDPADLVAWNNEMSQYSGFGSPSICGEPGPPTGPNQRAPESAVTLSGHTPSYNWAGVIAPRNSGAGFNYAYGHTYVPESTGGCSSDTHSAWVGLGGWNSGTLAQDGLEDSYQNSGVRVFWEMLEGTQDTGMRWITMTSGIRRSDEISFSTHYFPPSGTTASHFSFYVHDYRTGEVQDPIIYTALTLPAAYFYDSSTAEAIDERTQVGSNYPQLRSFGTQYWVDATDTRTDGTSEHMRYVANRLWLDMNNLHQTVMLANSEILGGSPANEFQVSWDACGASEPVP